MPWPCWSVSRPRRCRHSWPQLETQRNQLGTQDSVAAARADVTADHVRLYKALGGGWDPQATATARSGADRTPAPTSTPRT